MDAGKEDRPAGLWEATAATFSPAETFRLGRELGAEIVGAGADFAGSGKRAGGLSRALRAGLALALVGELGSGKTVFTKGLACGAEVRDPGRVTSPTFVLRQDYRGALSIHHYDVYRLSGPAELLALGFEEDLRPGAIVVVEWADRVLAALPAAALTVEFAHDPGPDAAGPGDVPGTMPADRGRRRITFRGNPDIWSDAIARVLMRSGG